LTDNSQLTAVRGFPDSIAYPEHSDSKYPYTADGSRELLKDAPFIDPFVLAAALSAVTKRLRFHSFVTSWRFAIPCWWPSRP
jgi:alkanesulfonate monooxygenase SsuD/methylene tetrahydromethanopterin reductase-like flavin-dependent oxidoreductase (luciferase family)